MCYVYMKMRGGCCVERVLLILVACVMTPVQSVIRQHPKCRTASCQYDAIKSQNSGFYYYVNGTMGFINQQIIIKYLDNDFFELWCNSHSKQEHYKLPADDPSLPTMPRSLAVKTVEIKGCTVPINSTFRDVLETLNVTFLPEINDSYLKLTELPAEPRLEGYQMEGLPVKKLLITAKSLRHPTRPKPDFLDKMQELHTLELKQNVVLDKDAIEHFPEGISILELEDTQLPAAESNLNNGSFWLERLRSLTRLHIAENSKHLPLPSADFTLIPPPLAALPNLTSASLYNVPLKPLHPNWLKGSVLQTLMLNSCSIEILPDNVFKGANLTTLHLVKNGLSNLKPGVFSPLQWLKELNLSNNNLTGVDLVGTLFALKHLEVLKVNNNPRLGSLCGDSSIIKGKQKSDLPQSLRHLELINTGATRICDDWTKHDEFLDYLALDKNNITNLTFRELIMMRDANTTKTPVKLSLKNNPLLKRIRVTEQDYDSYRNTSTRQWGNPKPVQVIIKLSNLECDCYDGYWLRETLDHCSLIKSNIPCNPKPPATKPRSLITYEPQDFTCTYDGPSCTPGCECQKRASDNATVMRCTGPLFSEPQWPSSSPESPIVLHVPPGTLTAIPHVWLVELHAPGNNITNLDEKDIPDTLHVLDVSNNNITHITNKAAQKLRDQNVAVRISGNPLACACVDAPAILNLKFAKVVDWNLTQCADGSLLKGKTATEMCESKFMAPLLGVTGTLLIIIVVLLILHRLSPQIKQFLFDHNMCLNLVLKIKDDPDDPMKTHDAFISYPYNDLELAKKLIEKLEEHGYSTIEHCRDWLPGKSVTQQIAHSVMSARRTLLLVSDNLVNSKWTLEEFHAAHAHAIERGSARVIVVRCKLLAPHKLPLELQTYLYNNTYLDWNDRYFWDKLWRVMPTPRPTPASPIALIPNQAALPSIRIRMGLQKTNSSALTHSRFPVDKDPPLSELVLVPSKLDKDDSPQSTAQILPLTTVTQQPPLSSEKNSSPLPKLHCESLTAPMVPAAVSPCAC